jgi:hypothetical protein
VLLVTRDRVPAPTAAALTTLRPRDITVVGGPAAVSEAVLAQLRAYAAGGTVTRAAGADRYATAASLAELVWPTTSPVVYLATGREPWDALTGVPAAGRDSAPVLLSSAAACPPPRSARSTAAADDRRRARRRERRQQPGGERRRLLRPARRRAVRPPPGPSAQADVVDEEARRVRPSVVATKRARRSARPRDRLALSGQPTFREDVLEPAADRASSVPLVLWTRACSRSYATVLAGSDELAATSTSASRRLLGW